MKHHLRDFLILLISYSGVVWLYRQWCCRQGPLVRVLCFHDVPDRAWFEDVIIMLKNEFHLLTPAEFHQQQFHPTKINLLLTFDDGYQSWVDVALPVLEAHNAKAIFFISSGALDAAEAGQQAVTHFVRDRLRLQRPRTLLTWEGAAALVAAGHTIGGHTVTHPSLAQLDREAAQQEITVDKVALETKLNLTLQDFAYPFGRTDDIISVTIPYAYSAVPEFFSSTSIIGRTIVDGLSLISLKRYCLGAYDLVDRFK